MKNKIINALKKLMWGCADKNFYIENKEALFNTNYRLLRVSCVVASVIFAALSAFSLFVGIIESLMYVYLIFTVLFAAETLLVLTMLKKKKSLISLFYYIFSLLVLLFVIYLGTVNSPTKNAVTFCVCLIVIPSLYVSKPVWHYLHSIVITAIFCAAAVVTKQARPDVYGVDIVNALSCLAVGAGFTYTMMTLQIKNIEANVLLKLKTQKDMLTGLLNKETAEAFCSSYMRDNGNFMFFLLDIDNFKSLNDNYGHSFGDEALRKVGLILLATFRKDDIIGRFGGDEFVILMKNTTDPFAALAKCDILNKKLKTEFEPVSDLNISFSAGVYLSDGDSSDYHTVFTCVDKALYSAKHKGKCQAVVYDPLIMSGQMEMLIARSDEKS